MLSQSLLQLRAVILHPAPDRCVIDIETTLLQQLLNIAQRERIAKIPPDGTKDDAGFGLAPFEDCGSGYHFAILSHHQPATLKVATHPSGLTIASAERQSHQMWESQAHNRRSTGVNLGRFLAERCSTPIWCRSARFSNSRAARERTIEDRVARSVAKMSIGRENYERSISPIFSHRS